MRKRLIKKLHEAQKWRRGGKGEKPFSPKEMSDEQFNELMNDGN